MRRRAWAREDAADETFSQFCSEHLIELVDEAIARVDAAHPPGPFWWRRPDPEQVLDDLQAYLPGCTRLPTRAVVDHLYTDRTLLPNPSDLQLLQEQFATWDHPTQQQARELIGGWDFLGYHHRSRVQTEGPFEQPMRDFLTSDATRLPHPVTVYRGEHPSEHHPDFATITRGVRAGDILHRSERPLAASAIPAGAARAEFCNTGPLEVRRHEREGWLLAVRTDRALYVGGREEILGVKDENARHELEVLIHAPRLRVVDVGEALVPMQSARKRLLTFWCVPA